MRCEIRRIAVTRELARSIPPTRRPMPRSHSLITQVIRLRRASARNEPQAERDPASPDLTALAALETRVAHLESLLEGLQDSVHRESTRQSKLLADLEARLEPSTLAIALSKDARERGL